MSPPFTFLKTPPNMSTEVEVQKKWLLILKEAENLVKSDIDMQAKRKTRLKERYLPPEVLGGIYAQYCNLINELYDAYLNSVHLQRASYMKELIGVFLKRMYEVRNELVEYIVNDYIYVDAALILNKLTPADIQIIIPYHFPLECRPDSMENLLQKMWGEAFKRKNKPPKQPKQLPSPENGIFNDDDQRSTEPVVAEEEEASIEEVTPEASVPTIIPEEFIQATIIQRHERNRQFYIADFRTKCNRRRMYFAEKGEEVPLDLKEKAAAVIQKVYRRYMEVKRERVKQFKRDVLLGIVPDPYKDYLKFEEENNKVYELRQRKRSKIKQSYMKDLEQENTRLLLFKKDNQIDDITDHVREWFREWFYGYGFFPEYPHELEGGTLLVIRGDYPTIEEKVIADEKYAATIKGKTKDQLKQEKNQAKIDAALKAEADKETAKKEAQNIFKLRCNPESDPGYEIKLSETLPSVVAALQKYRAAWSMYDNFQPERNPEVIFGYLKPMLTEDLMAKIHIDCRKYVDELMRIDLKLLIQMHELMYKNIGKKFPKVPPRKKPAARPVPKPLHIDKELLKNLEEVFNLGIITKPTTKMKDIYGDSSYAAYESNIRDPDAKFPPPGYGDIKRRLILSCIFGIGIEPGAARKKAVMLLGPQRQGKSFLVDAVAGELNAVKIDISPEVFSAKVEKPAKSLTQVFLAARVFQPAVIYMRNVERVFQKKTPPESQYLKAKNLKAILPKFIKSIINEDKVIFIATCSDPFIAPSNPMVSMFDEIILVPRTDYGSLQRFFYDKLQSIQSMPRDYSVQSLAQLLQGYGFGVIIEMFNKVMCAERIIRLNVTPLAPIEFLEYLMETGDQALTLEEYAEYTNFYLKNSPLNKARQEYEVINMTRGINYQKLAKKKAQKN